MNTKTQDIQDERVVAQRRKIYSEAYGILMIALIASVFVQQFFLDAPFEQYAVELICFVGMSIYIIIRWLTLGLDLYNDSKRAKTMHFVFSIVAGIVVTAINGVSNYSRYAEHYKETGIGYFIAVLAIIFISTAALVFVVRYALVYANKKRHEKIIKKLEEDDMFY